MKNLPVVAIIGQTNAGKSSLFNRFVGNRDAIVAREAGTTRDSVVRKIAAKTPFLLIDTAGLKNPEDEFEATIQNQIDDAIANSDLILLVKDATEPPTNEDRAIAKKALKSQKTVLLILNKIDLKNHLARAEFLRFGVKSDAIFEISAEHNQGISPLKKAIEKNLLEQIAENPEDFAKKAREKNEKLTKIALIGRPNVGKSFLFNSLVKKQQAIVAPIAGTTRDINRVSVKFKGENFEFLDTAGVRKPGKVEQGIEKFSVLRTLATIEESDICLLVIDANEPHVALDQKLAGIIADAGKGLAFVLSKWDSIEKTPYTRDEIAKSLAHDFDFTPWAPLILTSAVTGQNVTKIFDLIQQINLEREKQIPTRKLNEVLLNSVLRHPPAGLKNTHPKFRYVVQTDQNPPWFVIYGSNFKFIHWSYKRYIERQFRENFGFSGTPIKFSFRDEKQIQENRGNNSSEKKKSLGENSRKSSAKNSRSKSKSGKNS